MISQLVGNFGRRYDVAHFNAPLRALQPRVAKWHGANTLARGAKDSICDCGADNANAHFSRSAVPRVTGERTHVHIDLPGHICDT
jgi:hypothetical protein